MRQAATSARGVSGVSVPNYRSSVPLPTGGCEVIGGGACRAWPAWAHFPKV